MRSVHLQYLVTDDLTSFLKCSKCDVRFVNQLNLDEHILDGNNLKLELPDSRGRTYTYTQRRRDPVRQPL